MANIFRSPIRTVAATALATSTAMTLMAGSAYAAEWKYAIEEALTDVQGVYATDFKEYVEKNSDNTVAIFPFGTLGESADTTELAQMGAVQFVDLSPGFAGSLIPELQIFLVPYVLPEDQAVLTDFYKNSPTIHETLGGMYEEQSLHLLSMYPEGEVVMTTKQPVEKPADLDGVKFRVMTTPILVDTYNAFGATATPLPTGEIYSGLQLDMIQGQENPLFYVESTKFYEVTDYITFAGHNQYTTSVAANKSFYDGLSDEDQKVVEEAADFAYKKIMDYQKGLQDEAEKKIKEAKPSVTFTTLTDEQRQPFREAAKKVKQKYVELTGDSGKEVLEGFQKDLEASKERVGGSSGGGEKASGDAMDSKESGGGDAMEQSGDAMDSGSDSKG